MTQSQPKASVLLEVPDCRMEASVTVDQNILIQLGWPRDAATLVFENRRALQRFVRLSTEIMDAPAPDSDPTGTNTAIISKPD